MFEMGVVHMCHAFAALHGRDKHQGPNVCDVGAEGKIFEVGVVHMCHAIVVCCMIETRSRS